MKLITRDTDYAIRALCVIAKHGQKVVTVEALVRETRLPRPFLRKIMQILNRKKIIKSYKGRGGGFSLLVPPAELLLIDLIRTLQGPICLTDHTFRKKKCPDIRRCHLKKKLDEIEEIVESKLGKITLLSLIK